MLATVPLPDILRFPKAPIIEAIVDIDCDLPPKFSVPESERLAREIFCDTYPTVQQHRFRELTVGQELGAAPTSKVVEGINALRFAQTDGRQLVQVRANGFSFNRLAPYAGLDDYLPEIERTWGLFVKAFAPLQIRCIRLRYINRVMLPKETNGLYDLDKNLKTGPRLPGPERLTFAGFLDHHQFLDRISGHLGSIVLTAQPAVENELPLILDITVEERKALAPEWNQVIAKIASLRALKNFVFTETLTPECLNRFQ